MRPEKMALWNEFLPEQFLALEEPTTQTKPATTEAMSDDNKGEYYHTQSSIQL